jgi:hypothetical protein
LCAVTKPKQKRNAKNMISKMNSIRLSLAVAAGWAAATVSSQAQSATATIAWVAAGSSYNYTITLHNTGAIALNSFWYGWTTSGDNLPAAPSSPANSSGWGNTVSGHSIKWVNTSYSYDGTTYYYGTPLAPGASTTFTFVSSTPPSAITTAPSGESVAYAGAIDFSEDTAGDSTAVFSPALVAPPPSVPTVMATIYGVAAGSSYNYTITLQNTGTDALNSFWYGWTTSGDNLPSAPSSAGNSLGWSNQVSGTSIKWTNSSGTALAPGASTTFTFVSSNSPSAITTAPSGESVAYTGAIDFSEDTAGDSTAAFSPALVAPPPSVPTVTATIYGVAAGSFYNYAITLQNTGSVALNSFWYGWTTSGDNLPSTPSSAGNSLGWSNEVSGTSIKWTNSSGTALAPGSSTTFTFVSSSSPSAITTSPSGESVAYVGAIDFSEDTAGDSTAEFSPALVAPPVIVVTVNPAGSGTSAPTSIILAWPTNNAGITLQSTTNLFAPTVWTTVSNQPVVVNGQYTVTNMISGAQQFFRLVHP